MKTSAVEYNIILDADAVVTILNTPLTYKRGRHTVTAEEIADLRNAGAVIRLIGVVTHNAMMTGGAPAWPDEPQLKGIQLEYHTSAIFPGNAMSLDDVKLGIE